MSDDDEYAKFGEPYVEKRGNETIYHWPNPMVMRVDDLAGRLQEYAEKFPPFSDHPEAGRLMKDAAEALSRLALEKVSK